MITTPPPPGSRVWTYLRHSPGQDQTIQSQQAAVTDFCRQQGLILLRTFADEAREGSSAAGRDAFNEMIYLARQSPRQADAIVIWAWSRFARDFDDAEFFKADLRRRGWEFISMTDQVPAGRLGRVFESIIHWKDEQFLDDLGKAVKRGQQWLSRQGYVPGGFPPRGYVAVQERIGERADGRPRFGIRWVPDPELAPPVIQAWQMRAQGASYHKIQQATGLYKSLNCWTTFFANTAYRGVVTYGQVEISIPPLVDEATWQAVQARRVPRGHSRKGKPWNEEHPRRASSTYLLSGLLYCGLCGSAMSGSRSYKWRHYICTRRKRRRDCPAPRVGADKLEEAIITCLRQEILTSEHITTLLATINAELDSGRGEVQAERMQIEEKLRKANQAINRLLDAIEARGRSGAIEERLKVREQERDQLELHHKELLLREQQNTFYIASEDLAQLLDDLRRELLAAAPEDRRNALRALIHRVEITRGEVRLFYPVPFEQTGI